MAAPDLRGIIRAGYDILNTTVNPATKKILVQLGSVVGKTVDTDAAELWQQYGLASRPPKPVPGKQAAQGIVLRTSDHDLVIASQDLRGLELYGNLDYGEVAIYSAGEDGNGQARVLLKKDGGIHLYTRKGNTAGGAGMVVQLDAQNGAVRALNDKGYGLIADADGVVLTAGSSALTLKANGDCSLIGTGKIILMRLLIVAVLLTGPARGAGGSGCRSART